MVGEDYVPNQILKLKANLDIGPDWKDLHELPNDCPIEVIQQTLSEFMV